MKHNWKIKLSVLFVLMLIFNIPLFASNALYNDDAFEKYINFVQNSGIPNLFRNDSVYESYNEYPPIISAGVEYVPLSLFEGLPDIKINYSADKSNFYIQNKKKNKYISFSISGNYAVTGENRVFETQVKNYYGTNYVPLRLVCSNTGVGCDSYNDSKNKIYVIKVYTESGLSANELIRIYAPDIYGTQGYDSYVNNPNYGNRELYLYFTGTDLTYADSILNALSRNNLKGAFFVTKEDILNNPELIRKMYLLGNTIGITFNETSEVLLQENSLENLCFEAQEALYEVLKTKTRLVLLPGITRQAYAESNITDRLSALGLCDVRCNIDIRTDVLGHDASFDSLNASLKNLERFYGTQKAHVKLTYTYTSYAICDSIAALAKNTPNLKVMLPTEVSANRF